MKKCMIALSCALLAGVSMAASVTGNNTAVVIKKSPVESQNSKYQFLCVPVSGFDITGTKELADKTIALADMLPPDDYGVGTTVRVVDKSSGKAVYTFVVGEVDSVKCWVANQETTASVQSDDGETETVILAQSGDASNVQLSAKDVLWLQVTLKEGDSVTPDTIFCGEAVALGEAETLIDSNKNTEDGGIVTAGNFTSEAQALESVISDPEFGDTVYVINPNSSTYKAYTRSRRSGWILEESGEAVTSGEKILSAGEAFYYYRANNN